MTQISPERLISIQDKLCSQPFLKELRGQIRSNQQKIAKSTYNLESRNIKKFTHEWQAFKKKFKQQASNNTISKPNQVKKKFGRTIRYEENQTLQLSYDKPFILKIPQIKQSPQSRLSPSNDEVSVSSKPPIKGRYSLKKKQLKSLRFHPEKLSRQKSNSFVRESNNQPRNRIITQWQSNASKENEVTSRLSMKKGDSAPNPQLSSGEFFVDLSRQKINKYIQNLHRLQWIYLFVKDNKEEKIQESQRYSAHVRKFKYDMDSSIDEYAINYMISRRYNLLSSYLQDSYEQRSKQLQDETNHRKNQKFIQPSQYSLLNSLTSGSVINLIKHNALETASKYKQTIYQQQKDKTLYFSLPNCQFISYRYTKSSIYQLISMSHSANLKIAFTIYDKNRNGVIDTDDLVQIISLSRKIPILQADVFAITQAMMSETRKSTSLKRKIQIRSERLQSSSVRDRQYTQSIQNGSPIKQQSELSNDANQKPLSSSRFNIDKLYTFLKNKQDGRQRMFNKEMLQNSNLHSLTFGMFCKAFQNQRPVIALDLFQYLFGAPTDHFHPRYRSSLKTNPRHIVASVSEDQTLEEKWNHRLKQTNAIIEQFIRNKSQQKF